MEALQRVKLDGFQMVIAELEVEQDYLRRARRYLGRKPRDGQKVTFAVTCAVYLSGLVNLPSVPCTFQAQQMLVACDDEL
jgi:hypothetical protein